MDKTFFQSLSVVLVAVAFAGICWWAFSPSRRKKFNEAANLPFADEQDTPRDQMAAPQPPGQDGAENKVEKL